MSNFSFPIVADGSTTHLHFVNGVDQNGQPFTLAPASISQSDPTVATVTLDADGLGAVVQGASAGTSVLSVTIAGVTETADLVVSAPVVVPVLASFQIVADAPVPAAA